MSDFSDDESAGALFSKRRVDNIFDEMDTAELPVAQPTRLQSKSQRLVEEEYLWRHWFLNNTRPADILRLFTRADGSTIRTRNHYKDQRKALRRKYGECATTIAHRGYIIEKHQPVPEEIASNFLNWLEGMGGRRPNGAIGGLLPFVDGVYGKGFEGITVAQTKRTTGSAAVLNMPEPSNQRRAHGIGDSDHTTDNHTANAIRAVLGRHVDGAKVLDRLDPEILADVSSDEGSDATRHNEATSKEKRAKRRKTQQTPEEANSQQQTESLDTSIPHNHEQPRGVPAREQLVVFNEPPLCVTSLVGLAAQANAVQRQLPESPLESEEITEAQPVAHTLQEQQKLVSPQYSYRVIPISPATGQVRPSSAPAARGSTAPQNTTPASAPSTCSAGILVLDENQTEVNRDVLFVPIPTGPPPPREHTPEINGPPKAISIDIQDSEEEEEEEEEAGPSIDEHYPRHTGSYSRPSISRLVLSKQAVPIYPESLLCPTEQYQEKLKEQIRSVSDTDPDAIIKRQIYEIQLKAIEMYGPGGQAHPLAREAIREAMGSLTDEARDIMC